MYADLWKCQCKVHLYVQSGHKNQLKLFCENEKIIVIFILLFSDESATLFLGGTKYTCAANLHIKYLCIGNEKKILVLGFL